MSTDDSFKTPNPQEGNGWLAPAVLSDFDDTAAEQNVAELLLERFGHPTWREVRDRFRQGGLSLKEYQEITFSSIEADRDAMRNYVMERANFRPYFRELCGFCQDRDIPLAIVSQGLDFYITALLDKEGLSQIPVYASNHRVLRRGVVLLLPFPASRAGGLGQLKRSTG